MTVIIEVDGLAELRRALVDGEAIPSGIQRGLRSSVDYIQSIGAERMPYRTGRASRSWRGTVGHRSASFTGVWYIALLEQGFSRQRPAGFLSEIVEAGIDGAFQSAFAREYARHFNRLQPAGQDLIFQGAQAPFVEDIPF